MAVAQRFFRLFAHSLQRIGNLELRTSKCALCHHSGGRDNSSPVTCQTDAAYETPGYSTFPCQSPEMVMGVMNFSHSEISAAGLCGMLTGSP